MEDRLKDFLNEETRNKELAFLKDFTGNHSINLHFVNDDSCTNGRDVFLNPGVGEIYKKEDQLKEVETKYSPTPFLSCSTIGSLSFILRSLSYHEGLHIIHSNFQKIDEYFEARRVYDQNVDALLYNVINLVEDIYIEYIGSSSNIDCKLHLDVLNDLFYLNYNSSFNEENELYSLLSMIMKEFIWKKEYVSSSSLINACYENKIRPLIKEALTDDILTRLVVGYKIFMVFVDGYSLLVKKFKFTKSPLKYYTKERKYDSSTAYINENSYSGNTKGISFSIQDALDRFVKETDLLQVKYDYSSLEKKDVVEDKLITSKISLPMASRIIKESIDVNKMKEYLRVKENNSLYISRLSRLIDSLMKFDHYQKEEKLTHGNYIDSRRLIDKDKKYWSRKRYVDSYDNIVFLIMVDESSSMDSKEKKNSVLESIIVLHEAFIKSNIKHMICGYSAEFYKDQVTHSLLWDFDNKVNESYGLMSYNPGHKNFKVKGEKWGGMGTRDGASLLWAKDKLNKKEFDDYKKCIILISDGEPDHLGSSDNRFYKGGYALDDIRFSLVELQKANIELTALAIDYSSQDEVYNKLKRFYQDVIKVSSKDALSNNLIKLIYKKMQR